MRLFPLFFLIAALAAAQNLGVGIRAGTPINDAFDAASGLARNYRNVPQRFTIGPTFEVRLPFRLGIQLDMLYKRLKYETAFEQQATVTTANQWEFPLLAKWRVTPGPIAPFIETGISWRRIQGVSSSIVGTGGGRTPDEFVNDGSKGFVFGGGVEFKLLVVRLQPELRWTRWGSEAFRDPVGSVFRSNLNQAEFLVGLTF
jgi:opacity protein-like surface antigen